jgi:hypothetical protein
VGRAYVFAQKTYPFAHITIQRGRSKECVAFVGNPAKTYAILYRILLEDFMFKYFLTSVALAVLGLIIGTAITWTAVSNWTSLSTSWLDAAMIFPIFGLLGGLAIAEPHLGEHRGKFRAALAAVAMPLCGFANYLAFIITSRTWFGDRLPPESQSLVFQLMNPDIMPTFVHKSTSGSGLEQSWLMYLIVGLFIGPLLIWWTSRTSLRS